MTNQPPPMSGIALAQHAFPCYTPRAMPTTPTVPGITLHVHPEALSVSGWQEAIAHMAACLAQAAGLPHPQPLIDAAMEREYCEPTFLGKGMALPHARVAGLAQAGVCIAHAPAGIPWHDNRAQLIVFLAVPQEAPELYLQLMSKLVRWRLRLPDEHLVAPTLPAAEWEEELRSLLN